MILKRHCNALHMLRAEEWLSLAELLPKLCQAIHTLLGTRTEYILQLGEGQGYNHIHFHVVARLPNLPSSLTGRNILNAFGPNTRHKVSSALMAAFSIELRGVLSAESSEE